MMRACIAVKKEEDLWFNVKPKKATQPVQAPVKEVEQEAETAQELAADEEEEEEEEKVENED